MDPIPEKLLAHSGDDTGRRAGTPLGRLAVSATPWAIIGGLLWAGLFIKPEPVGSTVQPPALERRDYFYGLTVAEDGSLLVAGSHGKILSLSADGTRIERLQTPSRHTLQDIAVWDGRHAVAVGNGGIVLRSSDGGRVWTEVSGVPRSEVANKLNRVRVGVGGSGIATGEMGALLLTRDHGQTWQRLRAEEDLAWNDAALIDDRHLVVVGEFGRILVSGDSGSTWNEPAPPVPSSLMAVAFRDDRHGVAVGLEGVVLTTQDGGASWQPQQLDIHDHLFDIAWDAAGKRWIGAGALGRWIAADETGSQWTTGRLDERDLSWHTRIVPARDRVWLAGANVGHWDGKTWQSIGQ